MATKADTTVTCKRSETDKVLYEMSRPYGCPAYTRIDATCSHTEVWGIGNINGSHELTVRLIFTD